MVRIDSNASGAQRGRHTSDALHASAGIQQTACSSEADDSGRRPVGELPDSVDATRSDAYHRCCQLQNSNVATDGEIVVRVDGHMADTKEPGVLEKDNQLRC